jgi:ABC-type proline/glycine betaine transport system substrate-binding protein
MNRKTFLLIVCIIAITLFSACSNGTTGEAEPIKAVFADAGWDSIRFHNAVAIYIGEAAYNIDGKDIPGTTPITYNGMIAGDIDVYMEVWVDNLPTYFQDLEAGKFKELGINFPEPDKPIRTNILPRSTSKEMLFTATVTPNFFATSTLPEPFFISSKAGTLFAP